MKYLVFALLIASCGKYEATQSGNSVIGQNLEYSPRQIEGADLILKNEICRSIEVKTNSILLMNALPLSFTLEQKNCAGTSIPAAAVDVTIQVNNDSIFFMRSDNGQYFVFKDAETTRSGIMRSFCSSGQNPFQHNGIATWWDSSLQNNCSSKSNNRVCVTFKSGVQEQASTNYKIRTIESMLINTDSSSSRYGYYLERRIVSDLSCENKTQTEISATLN